MCANSNLIPSRGALQLCRHPLLAAFGDISQPTSVLLDLPATSAGLLEVPSKETFKCPYLAALSPAM